MIRERIDEVMERRGLTVAKLARDTGLDYRAVRGYLNAGKEIRSASLEKILIALGLELVERRKTEGSE